MTSSVSILRISGILNKYNTIQYTKLGRMWKKAVVGYFEVLLQYVAGETKEN
jgi:hypothetical protein